MRVSQNEKIMFPIIGLLLTCFLVPSGLPLLGMLFFGNLLRESGVTSRLAKTASGPLCDIVTILLGMTVGASTQASEFLTPSTLGIFALGFMAFIIASASGVLFVKIFNLVLPKSKKINPLIGNAGVSAVPMSARISNNIGLEYDSTNYLLMHAMGSQCSRYYRLGRGCRCSTWILIVITRLNKKWRRYVCYHDIPPPFFMSL